IVSQDKKRPKGSISPMMVDECKAETEPQPENEPDEEDNDSLFQFLMADASRPPPTPSPNNQSFGRSPTPGLTSDAGQDNTPAFSSDAIVPFRTPTPLASLVEGIDGRYCIPYLDIDDDPLRCGSTPYDLDKLVFLRNRPATATPAPSSIYGGPPSPRLTSRASLGSVVESPSQAARLRRAKVGVQAEGCHQSCMLKLLTFMKRPTPVSPVLTVSGSNSMADGGESVGRPAAFGYAGPGIAKKPWVDCVEEPSVGDQASLSSGSKGIHMTSPTAELSSVTTQSAVRMPSHWEDKLSQADTTMTDADVVFALDAADRTTLITYPPVVLFSLARTFSPRRHDTTERPSSSISGTLQGPTPVDRGRTLHGDDGRPSPSVIARSLKSRKSLTVGTSDRPNSSFCSASNYSTSIGLDNQLEWPEGLICSLLDKTKLPPASPILPEYPHQLCIPNDLCMCNVWHYPRPAPLLPNDTTTHAALTNSPQASTSPQDDHFENQPDAPAPKASKQGRHASRQGKPKVRFWTNGGFQDPGRKRRMSPMASMTAWRSAEAGGLEGLEGYDERKGEGWVEEARWIRGRGLKCGGSGVGSAEHAR
ncbi:hypothetical protein LTS18_009337, partial [Coniosporium uncinatum]